MGTIKDLVDLTTKLANSVTDRKIASDINAIQSLTSQLQSEQATIHETNIELREKCFDLKNSNRALELELRDLKSTAISAPKGIPTCPNCSSVSKPIYMKPIPKECVVNENVTHECCGCNYSANI